MKQDHTFQYLTEIVKKGFPEPTYIDVISPGDCVSILANSDFTTREPLTLQKTKDKTNVGFFFDGPIYPIRNGACYTLTNLMRALGESGSVNSILINCYRGWDDFTEYYDKRFDSIFMTPKDFYEPTDMLANVVAKSDMEVAQFYDTELLVNIGPRLKDMGVKLILEVQNINHVLLESLGALQLDVARALEFERRAFKLADYILCRSDVDMKLAIEQGADPTRSAVYRGGIFVDDFGFQPRSAGSRLLFLGHMYYQPNENALREIAEHILPKLDDSYTLTVIGIAPPKLIKKYSSDSILFKGGVDNLSEELLNYDIALAPLLEGSGTRLKVLDYLASGLPVIATDIAIEGLDPNITQHLYVENDIGRYASIIQRISQSVADDRRAIAALHYTVENYDWPACIAPFLNAYNVLKKPN